MRKWFSIISALVFLLCTIAIAGVWQLKRTLSALNIEQFSYRLHALNLREIKFSELAFVYQTGKIQQKIQLRNLQIDWQWRSGFIPHINTISAEHAQFSPEQMPAEKLAELKKNAVPIDATQALFSLPKTWSIPASFPERIQIHNLLVKAPCPTGVCSFAGVADVRTIKTGLVTTALNVNLHASPGDTLNFVHQLNLDVLYSVAQNIPKLEATIIIDKFVEAKFISSVQNGTQSYWFGRVEAYVTNTDEYWLNYFKTWNILIAHKADEKNLHTQKISLKSEWQLALAPLLALPKTAKAAELKQALTVRGLLDANISAPINILDLGEFSGQANIAFDIAMGKLNHYALVSEINAQHLVIPEQWQAMGLQADSMYLKIQSKVNDAADLAALPVEFSGGTQGALQSKVKGNLIVDVFAKKIIAEKLSLAVKAKNFQPLAEIQLANINADLQATGHWQPTDFALNISALSQLSVDVIAKALSLNAKAVQFTTEQLNVSGNVVQGAVMWPQLKFTANAKLKGEKLMHAQFNTNSWYWQGNAKGVLDDFELAGELGVGTSLKIKHQAKRKLEDLNVAWQVPDIFLLAANPFADTFKAWPPLLSLAQGKINASGNFLFNIENNNLINSKTNIQLAEVSGIYDTIIFQGLSSQVRLTTTEKTLQMMTDELSVNQVEKGFVAGPLTAAGKYQANWDKLTQGTLALKYFSGTVMGGNISTPKQDLDFSHKTQAFMLELKNINLATLLKQHSTSELTGSGQLSGNVPIEITPTGVRVTKGLVAAEPPGGQLKYKSQRATDIAKTQPSMKLITTALNDFRYSVLSSQVNYDESGKLLLAIKLQGNNPDLENGRPVNLNVNLEEDIPAMLASIQLSGKVTDVIKKRVQEQLQKEKKTSSPTP